MFYSPFAGKLKMGRGLFRRAMSRPILQRREARQPQKAGKRGAGVARAFTSAQPQQAGPFAEKEEQRRERAPAFGIK